MRRFDAVKRRLKPPSASMVVALMALFVALGGGAYAASQIDGHNIQNGTVNEQKFDGPTRDRVDGATGKHWGIITRNTIGSGVADLRAGPYGSFGVTGAAAKPPFGNGSLGIEVSDNATTQGSPQEKVSFGNEVDFYSDPVTGPGGLNRAGFRVFQSGENADINPSNMPDITLEIDPNVSTVNYTSMVWVPDPAPVTNRWTGFLDAATTGFWYFTNGTTATATGCGQADNCSLADAKAGLVSANNGSGPATIDTVAVSKGRDDEYVGAVDGLRINDNVYDFEPYGVETLFRP
jgi:hypothetical protein